MLVVLSGAPGSGKSTLAQALSVELGLDLVCIDTAISQKGGWSAAHWHEARKEMEDAVNSELRAVVDDDNHMTSLVKRLYRLAAEHRLRFTHLVLDTPLQMCQDRNSRRPNPIPEALVSKVHLTISGESFLPCSFRLPPDYSLTSVKQLIEDSSVAELPRDPDRRGSSDIKHQADLQLRRLIHTLRPSQSEIKTLLRMKADCLKILHTCSDEEASEILSVTEAQMIGSSQ